MDHRDHINLLRGAIPRTRGAWADFGSGDSAFTLALRELLGPEGGIRSIDIDPTNGSRLTRSNCRGQIEPTRFILPLCRRSMSARAASTFQVSPPRSTFHLIPIVSTASLNLGLCQRSSSIGILI